MLRKNSARALLFATCVTACMVKTNAAWSAGHDAAPTTPTKLLATIAVPGSPLASYDIGSVDPVLEHYFLSDRSNAALDIIDTRTNHVIGQVKGFSGSAGGNNNLAGPDGNAPTGDGLVWAGNGDSTVKVVDSRSMTIVQSISTGGTMRADEMSYDSKDRILLVANDADSPPFVSLIYTPDGYRQVLARISFKNATNGIEASVFDAAKGLFYVNIPQVGGSGHQGEVAVIDPILKKVIKTIPVRNCEPSGLALGPDQNLLLGCSTTNDANATPLPAQIISARSGLMLGSIPIGGSDQSIYDPGDKRYYLAARDNASGPVLGVVDALTRTLAASISTSTNSHSVAADPSNNHVFVPLTAGSSNAVCPNGCVAVYGR